MTEQRINRMFIELSRKFGFNPVYLRQILSLRNLGYNNTQIADQTGISRVTINTYIEKIRQHEDVENFKKLLALFFIIYVGTKFLEELLK